MTWRSYRNWCYEDEVVCWVQLFGWEYPVVKTCHPDCLQAIGAPLEIWYSDWQSAHLARLLVGGFSVMAEYGKTVQSAVAKLEKCVSPQLRRLGRV